jgi:hypothetical protein
MEPTIQLLVAAVLATAEFCAEPIDGDVGEPQFCRVASPLELSTPFFTISVEPHFLVGIDRDGRRLQVRSSLSRSQDYLLVEVREEPDNSRWNSCAKIDVWKENGVGWQDCRIATDESYVRILMAQLPQHYVFIDYGYSSLGTESAPALERMTQSIRVHAI